MEWTFYAFYESTFISRTWGLTSKMGFYIRYWVSITNTSNKMLYAHDLVLVKVPNHASPNCPSCSHVTDRAMLFLSLWSKWAVTSWQDKPDREPQCVSCLDVKDHLCKIKKWIEALKSLQTDVFVDHTNSSYSQKSVPM